MPFLFRILIAGIILQSMSQPAFSQSWSWVNQAVKGNGNNYTNAVCADWNNNVYITGRVKSTGVFGTGTGGVTLSNYGDRDIYLSKYDVNGNFYWVNHYGGTGSDYGYGVSSDSSGNTYLTGHFTTSGNFGSLGTINTFGSSDIYLLKHTASGGLLWVKHFGGVGAESGYAISTSKNGVSIVGGEFSDTSMFDTLQRVSHGGSDIFIGKFDSNGNPLWVRGFGGLSDDVVFGVYQNDSGYVYATGKFTGTVDFGGHVLSSTSSGNADIVTMKLDLDGNVLWAQKNGTGVADQGQSITTDPDGNVIVTGYWAQTNIVISKYSPSGVLLWSMLQGSPGFDVGNGVVTDSIGGIYVAGYYSGSITLGTTTLTCSGADDIFIEKLDPAGMVKWAKRAGGGASDHCFGLAINSLNELIVGGGFQGTSTFDSFTMTDPTGTYDAYIGKLVQPVTANFSSTSNLVCENGTVVFSDQSNGFPTGYEWSFPGGIPSGSTIKNPSVTYPAAGTYDVQLIVQHGSLEKDTLLLAGYIQVMAPEYLNISASDTLICPGSSAVLGVDSLHHDVLWSTGDTVLVIETGTPGIYTVTGADIHGCVSSDSVNLQYYTVTQVDISQDTLICYGDSITLDAGPGFMSYNWSTLETGQQVTVATPSHISVTVTDANNCPSSDSITINVTSPVVIFSNTDTVICYGDSITLDAGPGFMSYNWSTFETGQEITVTTPSNISVTVIDMNNCANSDSIMVNVYSPPTIFTNTDTLVCSGNTITLQAGAEYLSYLWSDGSTDSSISASMPGIYWVKITDTSLCSVTDSIELINYPISVVDLGNDTVVCAPQSVLIDAGAGFQSYLWSDGSVGNNLTVSTTAQVWVRVQDTNACMATDTIMITVDNCLAVAEPSDKGGFCSLFPNPARDKITILINQDIQEAELIVYNGNGEQIYATRLQNEETLSVSSFPKGIYLFCLRAGNSVRNTKIIIE